MPFFSEGKYKAKIDVAQLSEAKSGTPQVELILTLLGEYGGDGDLYEAPKTRFPPTVYLSLTENTLGTPDTPGWVANVLKHLGFKGDFEKLAEVEGWEGDVWCKHEDDQKGVKRDRWEIGAPRSSVIKHADKASVRKLNTLFGKVFKGGQLPAKPNGKKPQVEKPVGDTVPELAMAGVTAGGDGIPEQTEAPDDEIPF